jgi:two-component system response regulator FixJ
VLTTGNSDTAKSGRQSHAEAAIYLIDGDESALQSVSTRLKRSGFLVRAFSSLSAFLEIAPHTPPGCVICDIRKEQSGGIGLLAELRRRGLTFPVILAAGHGEIAIAMDAIRAGAADIVEKPFSDDTIGNSIRRAVSQLEQAGERNETARVASQRLALLTGREQDVLKGLIAGRSNRHIADDLAISVRTVEFYRGRAMRKMRARGLSELIRLALAAGVGGDL